MSDDYLNSTMEKIINKAKSSSLTDEEKTAGLKKIMDFMEKHPISEASSDVTHKFIASPYSIFFTSTNRLRVLVKRPLISVLVFLLLITGSGVLASANSLPGDILYGLKVNVKEPIESVLAFSTEAEILVETKHATARLEEVERLEVNNKLDEGTKTALISSFEKHSKNIDDKINKLRDRGETRIALEVSEKFEGSLSAHRSLIEGLSRESEDDNEDDGDKLAVFSALINKNIQKNSEHSRAKSSLTASASVNKNILSDEDESFEKIIESTERKIEEARKFIKDNRGSAEANIKAEADLEVAVDYFEEGKLKLSQGFIVEAQVLFNKANVLAEQIKVTLRSRNVIENSLNHSLKLDFEEKRASNDDEKYDEESNEEDDSEDEEMTIILDSLLE